MFINMPTQQTDGQLQKQYVIQTLTIKDNKQGTNETHTHTHKTNDSKFKSFIRIPYNIKSIIETVFTYLCFPDI